MRLKSTEKLSHENVYKCSDDKTTRPALTQKTSKKCSRHAWGGGGGKERGEGDEYREYKKREEEEALNMPVLQA